MLITSWVVLIIVYMVIICELFLNCLIVKHLYTLKLSFKIIMCDFYESFESCCLTVEVKQSS